MILLLLFFFFFYELCSSWGLFRFSPEWKKKKTKKEKNDRKDLTETAEFPDGSEQMGLRGVESTA